MSLVTGLFFLVILLSQQWSPPLRLQASHCSTFRIMCDVPSIAVFCSESIKCFPGTASKFFLKLLVTIPAAPIITGIIVHFRFHIRLSLYIIIIIIIIIIISILYMFRAAMYPSSGELIVSIRHLVYVILYRWPFGVQVWMRQLILLMMGTWLPRNM